jgi:hypothetical protein
LYDTLGVGAHASADELRRAYYRAARLLHPDLNPSSDTTDPMRRLNDAWAVLSDPDRRRRYDERIGVAPARPPSDHYRVSTRDEEPPVVVIHHPLARLFRPSVLILAVLVVIFVVTAYAAPHSGNKSVSPTIAPATSAPEVASTTTLVPTHGGPMGAVAPTLMGSCIQPQGSFDAVIPCSQPNVGMVIAQVASASECPQGTNPYHLLGRNQMACLLPVNRP